MEGSKQWVLVEVRLTCAEGRRCGLGSKLFTEIDEIISLSVPRLPCVVTSQHLFDLFESISHPLNLVFVTLGKEYHF